MIWFTTFGPNLKVTFSFPYRTEGVTCPAASLTFSRGDGSVVPPVHRNGEHRVRAGDERRRPDVLVLLLPVGPLPSETVQDVVELVREQIGQRIHLEDETRLPERVVLVELRYLVAVFYEDLLPDVFLLRRGERLPELNLETYEERIWVSATELKTGACTYLESVELPLQEFLVFFRRRVPVRGLGR